MIFKRKLKIKRLRDRTKVIKKLKKRTKKNKMQYIFIKAKYSSSPQIQPYHVVKVLLCDIDVNE